MSRAEEFEEKIREKRILEATKKGIMGQNGKIGVVLKMFGGPIVSQSEGGYYVDSNYIDLEGNSISINNYNIDNPSDFMKYIPIMNIEGNQRPNSQEWTQDMPDPISYGVDTIGIHFDGLGRGMHLEIKYDEISSELVVYHKGYLVYKESKGELLSYVPNEEWEKWIDSLYKVAKEKQRVLKEKEFEESVRAAEKEKSQWWELIKKRWGVR
jgi:hypothetical protein